MTLSVAFLSITPHHVNEGPGGSAHGFAKSYRSRLELTERSSDDVLHGFAHWRQANRVCVDLCPAWYGHPMSQCHNQISTLLRCAQGHKVKPGKSFKTENVKITLRANIPPGMFAVLEIVLCTTMLEKTLKDATSKTKHTVPTNQH